MDYKASGSITNTEGKKLYESLQKRISELKGRPRLYGFDITVETDEVEIYINSYDDMEFNFDISSSNFQVLSNYMNALKDSCDEIKCNYDISYSNSDDDFISDTLFAKSN